MKFTTTERLALIIAAAAISGVAGIVILFYLLQQIGIFQ